MSIQGPMKNGVIALLAGGLVTLAGCSAEAPEQAASDGANEAQTTEATAMTAAASKPTEIDPETERRFREAASRRLAEAAEARAARADGAQPQKGAAPSLGAVAGSAPTGGGAKAKPAPSTGTGAVAAAAPAPAINMTGGTSAATRPASAPETSPQAANAALAAARPAGAPASAPASAPATSSTGLSPSDRAAKRAALDAARAARNGGAPAAAAAAAPKPAPVTTPAATAPAAESNRATSRENWTGIVTDYADGRLVAEPAVLEFGDIPLGQSKTLTLRLQNNTDQPYTLIECRASCGCTTTACPKGQSIAPGEAAEIEIQLDAGEQPKQLSKTVTFLISDGHAPIRVPLEATAVAYVTAQPELLDKGENPDGKIVLTADDGQPFRVISMFPAIMTPDEFPQEPQAEIELNLDWDRLYESGSRQRRLLFRLDHPQSDRVLVPLSVNVLRDMRELAAANAPAAGAGANVPAPRAATADLNRLLSTGQTDTVLKLIADGEVDVMKADNAGHTPLIKAARYGDVEIIMAVVDLGADLEAKDGMGRTPLSYASQSGSLDAVLTLLDLGADVKYQDQTGNTPLGWAAGFGTFGMVEAMVEAGADVNTGTGTLIGFTPLIWAASVGEDADKVQYLIEAGSDLEARDTMERASVLHHAIRTNKLDHVKMLIEAGADIKARDGKGNTVMHTAARNPAPDKAMIEYLVSKNAELNIANKIGDSALDLTKRRKDVRAAGVIEALKAAGAERMRTTDR